MARKKVIYKEPASYFNADMRKAADDWEKNNKKKKDTPAKKTGAGKTKKG